MKLGNVSQSIVPVPKFFLNNKSIDLIRQYSKTETNFSPRKNFSMKKKLKNRYYRARDILSLNLDFNINLNPRFNHMKSISENKKKYIPLYLTKKFKNNSEIKGTYFPDIIYINNLKTIQKYSEKGKNKTVMQQYKEYKKSNNIEQKINPDLRSDIIHITENLLTKINYNLDFERWKEFDARTKFNLFYQTAYSPLTDYNKENITERDAFRETLREKAMGLKIISNKAKATIQKSVFQNELEKNLNEKEEKNNAKKIGILVKNSKNNFLKLKYNNMKPPKYNKKDEDFIKENRMITERLNRTKLYKNFPSAIREEFIEKRIYKNNRLFTSQNFTRDNKK